MADAASIVLTGFMGCGKSTVARLLAARLDWPCVDLDARIEARAGKSIARIFAEDGEPHFRELESQLVAQLPTTPAQVVATGGGTLLRAENRARLESLGQLVCLWTEPEVLAQRLAGVANRPLLAGDLETRTATIRSLLTQRAAVYRSVPLQLDTSRLTAEQVVDRLLDRLRLQALPGPRKLRVQLPIDGYDIWLGEGLLGRAAELMQRQLQVGRAALITHPALAELHAAPLLRGLRELGFEVELCTFPSGERFKTLATVAELYARCVAAGLDRQSPVIALGGGVAGDVAGFTAATYLRGVPFVQIPSSLLAMVDASVGGKTGVDLPEGKNLVGAFKQPAMVLIDPSLLATLPDAELRSGLAEVVKHALIASPELFAELEQGPGIVDGGPRLDARLLEQAVRVKVDIVRQDPFERGRRAVLNLGHTFGHAIEQVSAYGVRHGEGVALGCLAATWLAIELGSCDPGLLPRLRALHQHLGLPVHLPAGHAPEALVDAMATDKKRAAGRLRLILPRALGDVDIAAAPARGLLVQAFAQLLPGT